jgi:hypothetical protein
LAIDGSAKYSDRRHAQNAADTAALAGAYAKITGDPTWQVAALNQAGYNGYDDTHATPDGTLTNDVYVYSPPQSGIYQCTTPPNVHFDCHDYVQVIIDSNVNTWFARVIGIWSTHNHVEAVASTISANNHYTFGGNSVVALSPTGCALVTQGNAIVNIVGGGMYSNSDDPSCSYKKNACAGTINVDSDTSGTQGTITTIGGYSINTGCMPDAGLSPAGGTQISFPPPYQEIAPPAECSIAGTHTNSGSTTLANPGHFTKIPDTGWKTNVVLNPGVYCIDTELRLNASDNLTVNGTFSLPPTSGVFLYFKPGGSFTINGGANVNIWGVNDASSPYNHYLMYLAPNYTSGTPANCKLNGNATDNFWGAIYAPFCDITIDGTSAPTGYYSQIIGYTVTFNGTSDVTLNYSADSSPYWNIPLQVGLTR